MDNRGLLNHVVETMEVGSKSFATAAKLFDARTRRSVLMLYAWCRHCDDIIDHQIAGFQRQGASPHTPQQRLAELTTKTRQAFAGQPMQEPAFAAFQDVARRHLIQPYFAFDHLEGFAMDVREQVYETSGDLLRYCYHVAGVVGLMMAQIMGVTDKQVLDRACDLGLAFQLTNIARDIVEDVQAGRCYLPRRWLADEGLTVSNFALPEHRQALSRVATRLVDEAESYYRSALAGLQGLPLRSAWAIASARRVYRKIGLKVKKTGEEAWQSRVATSRFEKLSLLIAAGGDVLMSRLRPVFPRADGLWQRP